MADTRVRLEVEDSVRRNWMAAEFGTKSSRERLPLRSGGVFDFDAVSERNEGGMYRVSSLTTPAKHLTTIVLVLVVLSHFGASQQITTGEDYALQLQRMYSQNGYDISVRYVSDEKTLVLKSDEFRDPELREAIVRELRRDTKTICGL